MKSDVENLSPTRVKLTVEVPFDELAPQMEGAYKRIAAAVNIPGFRKGKVPARIIDQRFGRAAVLEEVVNDALPVAYDRAVADAAIVPVTRPEIEVTEINDTDGLKFTAEVDVRPDFEIPSLDDLAVEVDDAEVTDEDLDEQLVNLRTRFATLKDAEGPVVDGHVLTVDLSGTYEGEEVEDLAAKAISYEVGKDGLVPGFDEAVRGASAGDECSFDFTPTAGPYEGKDVVVTVAISAIRERILPEADDEFAMMASEFDTIDELREDMRTRIADAKQIEQGMQARNKVHEKLGTLVDFPIPEGVLSAEIDEHFHDGHGDEEHRSEFVEEAKARLKTAFILDKIAETEEIQVDDNELSSWLVQQAPRYGMSPDEFANALVEAGQVQSAVADVRRGKALASVLERAKITDASGREVNLKDLDEKMARMQLMQQIQQIQAMQAQAAAE